MQQLQTHDLKKKRNYNTNLKVNLEGGGVLSPKLFNEFLQDLGKHLNSKYGLNIGDIYLTYVLFAGDIVLFSEFAKSLQASIDFFLQVL